jgi:hypothetical protein
MLDWLLSQQIAISIAIIMLLIIEGKCMAKLGPKLVYTLWLLKTLLSKRLSEYPAKS